MNIFDVIGPVMVGPSSSHTAGAVRIGYVARQLLGEEVREAKILLYGSFLATGKGHGTDKALTAGLLGMQTDDYRIPKSIEIAEDKGMKIAFGEAGIEGSTSEYGTALFERHFGKDDGACGTVAWRRTD